MGLTLNCQVTTGSFSQTDTQGWGFDHASMDRVDRLRQCFVNGLVGVAVDGDQKLHGIVTKMDLVDFLTGSLDAETAGAGN